MPLINKWFANKLVLLALILSVVNSSYAEPQPEIIKPVKLYEIPLLEAVSHDDFLAEVDTGNRSHLSFQVSGVVKVLNVKQGQRVKKGQLLASLDPTDFQLAVDAAQAQFFSAKMSYQRDQTLFKKKLISTNTLDQSETAYKTAQANLEQAQTDLRYSKINAPFDGIISLSFIKAHQFIYAKDTVLNIINTDKLDIKMSLPVSYVDRVGIEVLKQLQLSVAFDLNNQIQFPATFKEMSTQPDTDTNSYTAIVQIQRPNAMNVLIGMTGQVFINREKQQQSLKLPDSAWASKEPNKGKVWRFDPDTHRVHLVSLAIDSAGVITGALKSGDMIVIAGTDELYEGQIVKAWEREGGI